jgi:hypothetical protein
VLDILFISMMGLRRWRKNCSPQGTGGARDRRATARRSRAGRRPEVAGQLSSRTLTVSTCCWKATALPPFMVHTWTMFTTAGSPELLCFHL